MKTNLSRDQAVVLLTTNPTSPAMRLSASAAPGARRDRFCSCYLVGAATAEAVRVAVTKRATLENILIWKVGV